MRPPPKPLGEHPVRAITKNHRAVTGTLASTKGPAGAQYESALERDFFLQLDFDPSVARFVPQPVLIPWVNGRGRKLQYPPDVLVHYSDGRRPALFEVKYVAETQEKADELRIKFRAARAFAREQGWAFTLVTERTVRAPSLKNIQFLRPYAARVFAEDQTGPLLTALGHEVSTPESLLSTFPEAERPHLIPALWHLVATHRIEADLSLPFTMKSAIRARRRS